VGHIQRIEKLQLHIKDWSETHKGRKLLVEVEVSGKIILNWNLQKLCVKIWTSYNAQSLMVDFF
jgi:hypothetical protein